MTCNSFDLTIDGALADPVIGAAMRADRVNPIHFETLLRNTARHLRDKPPAAALPVSALASCLWKAGLGVTRSW